MFWTTAAHAMAPAGAGGAEAGGLASLGGIVPLILMFAVFYFLLIRPQQKRAKEHKAMLAEIKPGDEIVTAGGLYGRVVKTAEDHLMVDLGNSQVKLTRSAVSAVVSPSRGEDKKDSGGKKTGDKKAQTADKDGGDK